MGAWFHGTSRKHVADIIRDGLRPPAGVIQPAGWLMVTDSFAQAARYAGVGGVVIEFDIPEALTDYRADGAVLWPARPHDCYGVRANAAAVKGRLPGEFIARVHEIGSE